MNRFSLESVRKDCAQEGIPFEVRDKSRAGTAVQADFFSYQLARMNDDTEERTRTAPIPKVHP